VVPRDYSFFGSLYHAVTSGHIHRGDAPTTAEKTADYRPECDRALPPHG
jgi:hypothetical protein